MESNISLKSVLFRFASLAFLCLVPSLLFASNWNTQSFDYEKLDVEKIPPDFPNNKGVMSIACKNHQNKSWKWKINAFYSNSFFWAFGDGKSIRTLFIGKRVDPENFLITSSQARKEKKDHSEFLSFRVNTSNIHESLLAGDVLGKRSGNSWSEECTISADPSYSKSAVFVEIVEK